MLTAIILSITHSWQQQRSHFYAIISGSLSPGAREKLHSKIPVRSSFSGSAKLLIPVVVTRRAFNGWVTGNRQIGNGFGVM